MPTTIALPDALSRELKAEADRQQLSLDELVARILADTLKNEANNRSMLDEVVAKIKATPSNPANFHPAAESLAELLRQTPDDPAFDVEAWNRDWARIEAEMKAMTRANDLAEGRG